jgi:hypothetical protein
VAGGAGGTELVYYLTAAYQGDGDQKVLERRPGVCLPEGTVRLSEEPSLNWRSQNELQEGYELILAKAWVRNCQLSRPVSLAARRYARPSQQPYIAAGQTAASWDAWQANNQVIGVRMYVDTSSARFRTTPQYTAHVIGERFLAAEPGPLLLAGFPTVINARRDGFSMQVLLPEIGQGVPRVNPTFPPDPDNHVPGIVGIVKRLGWHVVWMGVEA